MTPRAMRKAERAVHLVWALVLVLDVYGFLPSWGESAVRWVVVPGIAASGFAMWFAAPLRKLFRNARGRLLTSRDRLETSGAASKREGARDHPEGRVVSPPKRSPYSSTSRATLSGSNSNP